MVLSHRPEFQSRWSGQGHVGALNLSKLTRTQRAAMVSALAGGREGKVAPDHDLVAVVRWIDNSAIDGFLKRLLTAIDHG
jgi:hypothetical protein